MENRHETNRASSPDKRVQWADNLEEIRYFIPPSSLGKTFKNQMKKIKRKASEITDKPLRVITTFGELSANVVQNGLELILRQGQSGSFDANRLTYEDLIKEWDKLFEQLGEEEVVTDDDECDKPKPQQCSWAVSWSLFFFSVWWRKKCSWSFRAMRQGGNLVKRNRTVDQITVTHVRERHFSEFI